MRFKTFLILFLFITIQQLHLFNNLKNKLCLIKTNLKNMPQNMWASIA
jgi:hypothetical protein